MPDGNEYLYWQVDKTEGEQGFRRDHVNLLRDVAGYFATTVSQQTDFRLRRAAQAREQTLDEIASLIERFLPPPKCRGCGEEIGDRPCACIDTARARSALSK